MYLSYYIIVLAWVTYTLPCTTVMLDIRKTVELKIYIFKEFKAHQINDSQMKCFFFYFFQRPDSLKPEKIAKQVKYGWKHNKTLLETKIDQTHLRKKG